MTEAYAERIAAVAAKIAETADASFKANPFETLHTRVFVAASARSGSNVFCEGMRAHGARIGEYFHARRLRAHLATTSGGLEAWCRQTLAKAARGRAFGLKGSLDALAVLALAGEYPAHIGRWRFVFLRREDVVKQAISHLVALRSGAWRSVKAAAPVSADAYDAEAIAALARRHLAHDAQWLRLFAEHGLAPHRITYEQLVADPGETCAAAAVVLGLGGRRVAAGVRRTLERQAGPVNDAWEQRFWADCPDLAAELAAQGAELSPPKDD